MATIRQTYRSAHLSGGQRTRRRSSAPAAVARYLGALALLAMAVIHLVEFSANGYSQIPTIGTLFLLNFIGGTALAVALMSPLDRALRRGGQLLSALAAAGAVMAAVSIAFLLISEHTTLFGFREAGYRLAIVLALIAEGVALLCLGGFVAVGRRCQSDPSRVRP